MPVVRRLVPADGPALDAFLLEHADASLFLRSNVRAAGLVDGGAPYEATYAGAFDGARLVAVAAHCWNGTVLLQAPRDLADVVRAAIVPRRPVVGVLGPWPQVTAARAALGLDDRPARLEAHEVLMALDLADLVVPSPLAEGWVACRPTRDTDLPLVVAWRVAFMVEELHRVDDDETRRIADEDMRRIHAERRGWLLEVDGAPVAFSGFNARLPDVVQIGGVFTPPAERRRGYARAVVAGSLLDARATGTGRSVLFTGEAQIASRRAYDAIGFRVVGDYGMLGF